MTEPRKRFRIHLSTAMVMMIVAGILLWANIHGGTIVPLSWGYQQSYGWPFEALKGFVDPIKGPRMPSIIGSGYARLLGWLDLSVAIAILYATWRISEWLIRRRAARKSA